jgi:hypothetical protein
MNLSEAVIASVRSNVGGSLPPTQADFVHSIELLIHQGMKKWEIIDGFPLPKGVTTKYYGKARDNIYQRRMGNAIDKIVAGSLTLLDASERYKIPIADLRAAISGRKERGVNIASALGAIETRVRSLGMAISGNTKSMIAQYKEGNLSPDDLKKITTRLKESMRRLQQNADSWTDRVQKAIAGIDEDDTSVVNSKVTTAKGAEL